MRKVATLLAIGGGLRHAEAMGLSLEMFQKVDDGYFVKFKRVKMRNNHKRRDKEWSKMHIPFKLKDSTFSPAGLLEEYLEDIWKILGKNSGRVFWTGRDNTYTNQPLGKNSLCKLPKEIAKHLKLAHPERYVFHSFRRTAATFASEAGMSDNELCDFFSWLNSCMAREYTSSTNRATRTMGSVLLGGENRFQGAQAPSSAPALPAAAPALPEAAPAPPAAPAAWPSGIGGASPYAGGPFYGAPAAAPAWPQNAAPAWPQNAAPAWPQNAAPAWPQNAALMVQRPQADRQEDQMNDSLDEFAAELDQREREEKREIQPMQQQSIVIKTKDDKKQVLSAMNSMGLKEIINKDTKIEKFVFNIFHKVDTVNN